MGLLKGADIAIDLGTASVLVYVNKEGIEEYKFYPIKNNTEYKEEILKVIKKYKKEKLIQDNNK